MSLRREGGRAAIFILPVILLWMLVGFVPLAFIVYTSTTGGTSAEPFFGLIKSTLFLKVLTNTIVIAVSSSLISLVLGYIVALHLARQNPRRRTAYMMLVLLPFWTSILVKSYSFTIILGRDGIINSLLSWLLQTHVRLPLIFNRVGVLVGMTNYLTPFIVFPVLASLLAIDPALYRAAEVMGAKPARIFRTVTLPLSMPGVWAGLLSVTVMGLGFFVVPALLGGRKDMMLANLVDFYTREVLDWNTASAVGVLLFALVAVVAIPAVWLRDRSSESVH